MKKQNLKLPIDKLKQAIDQLEDDRDRQLEIYENLTEHLFGEEGTMKGGRRGLLDVDIVLNVVNLLNNMTSSSKTLSEISRILFETYLIQEDFVEGSDVDDDDAVIDRKKALKIVNTEE